jgi:hypothetical protein
MASPYKVEMEKNREKVKHTDLNVESLFAKDLLSNEWRKGKQNRLPLEKVAPAAFLYEASHLLLRSLKGMSDGGNRVRVSLILCAIISRRPQT